MTAFVTTSRACPSGCGRPVATGKLMCVRCWREVPKELQAEVYSTWRIWKRDMSNATGLLAYRAASDAATAAIA